MPKRFDTGHCCRDRRLKFNMEDHTMRRAAIMLAGFVSLLTLGAMTQENRSEISLQGTGFFPQDSNGQGISRTTSDTGGFMVGYRYHFNRWLSAEGNYG